MKNIIKDILIAQLSFPLKYKNEKEIWWENDWGSPITIEIIDIENKQYVKRGYYGDGQLCYKENYHQGQLHGELLWWHNNGQLWVKENYHQGQLHGECSVWYMDGEPEYKKEYNHGKLISEEHR